jgi:hypothetical protein
MNILHFFMLAIKITGNPFGWADGLITFLYLGPETIMPLASILATIVGGLLIFWRFIWRAIKRFLMFIFHRKSDSTEESSPTSNS